MYKATCESPKCLFIPGICGFLLVLQHAIQWKSVMRRDLSNQNIWERLSEDSREKDWFQIHVTKNDFFIGKFQNQQKMFFSQIQSSYDHRSYQRNLSNCLEKPEKFRTSTGFEPVSLRYRCDTLINLSMKPLTLGALHLWVLMFSWWRNERMKWCMRIIYWTADMKSSEAMILAVMIAI